MKAVVKPAPIPAVQHNHIIHTVNFVVPAMINFVPQDAVTCDKFNISLHDDLVLIADKTTKVRYMVPLSNVRSVRLADE